MKRVGAAAVAVAPVAALAAVAVPPAVAVAAAGSEAVAADGFFTAAEHLTRQHLVDGQDQTVDSRDFSVRVSQTRHLRDREEITVAWHGAHSTGGTVGDHNSGNAVEQEYPVMLVECRGVDSATAPTGQQPSPQTCFTHTPAERFQSDYNFNYPPFRLDRYGDAADRSDVVGRPDPLPDACSSSASGIQHWVPFVAASGTVYPGGSLGCAGVPPEAVNVENQLQPTNTTYGVSDASGSGEEKFVIATSETNASLGCSQQVACSLVVVPVMGISCDPAGATLPVDARPPVDAQQRAMQLCSATGHYQAGQENPGTVGQEDLAVSGALWWSPSNWRGRISVPLQFDPPANLCALQSSGAPTYVYGSEAFSQVTQQWAPAFCLDPKLFRLQHVLTGEPQAKNLLRSGSIPAAFAAGPPLHAHHVREWARGGCTDLGNLVLLCARHHTLVHEQGFLLSLAADRALLVMTATGRPVPHRPVWPTGDPALLDPGELVGPGTLPPNVLDARLDLKYAVSVLAALAA